MTKKTLPQEILGKALAKVAPFNKTHVDLYKEAGMSPIMFQKHWKGETTFMTPTTENNIDQAVARLVKDKKQ